MPPPQLTADAPVLDILHPIAVGILEFRGIELDVVLHHRFQGDFRQMLHLQEPLHGQLRLDRHARTLGATHLVLVSLHLLQQARLAQILLDPLAHLEPIHPHVQAGRLAQRTVVVEDIDRGQIVLLAQHIIVHVVRRRHLQASRTELDVHVLVLNHGNLPPHERHDHLLTFQMLVLRVVRVDTHRRIAHNRLRARGRYDGVSFLAYDLIPQVIQFAMLFLIDDLLVGEGGQRLRVPIHHPDAPINQAFII